jgi:hypothetical protein
MPFFYLPRVVITLARGEMRSLNLDGQEQVRLCSIYVVGTSSLPEVFQRWTHKWNSQTYLTLDKPQLHAITMDISISTSQCKKQCTLSVSRWRVKTCSDVLIYKANINIKVNNKNMTFLPRVSKEQELKNKTILLKHLQDASQVCDKVVQLGAQEESSISLVHSHKQLPVMQK